MHPFIIRTSSLILKTSSIVFIVAALYHLFAIFFHLNNSGGWRNLVFVLVNLWCSYEIRKFKNYFILLFTVLFVQQLISHGNSIIKNFANHNTVWLDISVLIFMTIIYVALIISAITNLQIEKRKRNFSPGS